MPTFDVVASVRIRVTAEDAASADVHVVTMLARKVEEMKDSPAVLSGSIGIKPGTVEVPNSRNPVDDWTALGDGRYRLHAAGWYADVKMTHDGEAWRAEVITTNTIHLSLQEIEAYAVETLQAAL